jgi:hypothetical protein
VGVVAITSTPLQPIEAAGLENEKAILASGQRSRNTLLCFSRCHHPSEVLKLSSAESLARTR